LHPWGRVLATLMRCERKLRRVARRHHCLPRAIAATLVAAGTTSAGGADVPFDGGVQPGAHYVAKASSGSGHAVGSNADPSDPLPGAVEHIADRQRVNLVTYMNEVSPLFGFLQVTAAAHGLHPRILGYGDQAWWPEGLGAKINALRHFVRSEITDEELVLFVDAFDVLVFAGRAEIASRFEELERQQNRSLFFNAEKVCFPPFDDICTEDYPESEFPQWRYLNSGAFIGRGAALKRMLKDPVDDIMPGSDQAFYQRYFRYFPERVGLDTHCQLLCATQGVGDSWGIVLQGSRMENRVTGSVPGVVHFVSNAHWAQWREGRPTTDLNDVFHSLHPAAADRLFGVVELVMRVGGSHRSKVFSLKAGSVEAYHKVMRAVLCIQCRLLGSADRECDFVPSLACDMCAELRFLFELVFVLSALLLLACFGRWRGTWQLRSPVPVLCCGVRGLGRVAEIFSKAEKAV